MFAGRLTSQSCQEDDLANMRLKKLLQEQTIKNESLNEKNIRLNIQLKSLLTLLQKKDLKIQEMVQVNSLQFLCKSFACKKAYCWLRDLIRSRKIKTFSKISTAKYKTAVFKIRTQFLLDVLRSLKNNKAKSLLFVLKRQGKYFEKVLKLENRLRFFLMKMTWKVFREYSLNRQGKILKADSLIQKSIYFFLKLKVTKRKFKLFFDRWKFLRNPIEQLDLALRQMVSYRKSHVFFKISQFSQDSSGKLQDLEIKNSEKKCKVFCETFSKLNNLTLVFKKVSFLVKSDFFARWSTTNPVKNTFIFFNCLRKLVKSRFSSIFKQKSLASFIFLLKSKVLLFKISAFSALKSHCQKISLEIVQFESQTLETKQESIRSLLKSSEVKLTELKEDNIHLKKKLEDLEASKNSKISELNSKKSKNKDLESKLSKHLKDIKRFQTEAEEKLAAEEDIYEKLTKDIEKNNLKIETIEKEIDTYCEDIKNLENEGRLSAISLAQLESSFKKLQEMHSTASSEKNRLTVQEADTKKQKILFATKIDSLAEEKEKILEKISQIKHEKNLIIQEILSKNSEFQEHEEKITEYQAKCQILNDKKIRLSENREEEFDLKGNLLSHKKKEALKLKEILNHNNSQIENLLKDFNSAARSEELERIQKMSSEFSQVSFKNDEVSKEILIENQKILSFASSIQVLTQEKEKLQDELKITQEFLMKSQDINQSLKNKLSEIAVYSHNSSVDDNSTLKEYSISLELKIKELTDQLTVNPALSRLSNIKSGYETKIEKLEKKLKECQEFALKSRADVAEAISEIENYARILNVLEEKMNETEEQYLLCIRQKEDSSEELNRIKESYFGLISKG